MSTATTVQEYNATGIPSGRLGMWLFLASEVMLFGAFISSYIVLRIGSPNFGVPSADVMGIPLATGNTIALLASSVFGHQQARVGRVALEPQRLATLVRKLEDGGGRARIEQLAQAIEMPAVRMRGVVSILQRTLNIDGFPVVTFEQATGTVLLDLPLLRTQFQL